MHYKLRFSEKKEAHDDLHLLIVQDGKEREVSKNRAQVRSENFGKMQL